MYIGTILPFAEFHRPEVTGITLGRLFILGFLILVFRRIPAIFMMYRMMPRCVKNWKEALFMGYFGPIGMLSSMKLLPLPQLTLSRNWSSFLCGAHSPFVPKD